MRTRPASTAARMSRSDRTLTGGESATAVAAAGRPPIDASACGAGATSSSDDLAGTSAALGEQGVDLALQLLQVVEGLVDAGEPDVGDLVERTQTLHGQLADGRRRDLVDAQRAQMRLDGVRGIVRGLRRHRDAG